MKEVNRAQRVGRHAASDTRWTGACTKTPDWVYENSGILSRHRLVLPPPLALLFKTIVMCEGLGARLDPSFPAARCSRLLRRAGLTAAVRLS